MDSFKVILTKERNKTFFSAVPHNWESKNFVYWPTKLPHTKRELLRSNGKSKPEGDWDKYKCIVKLSNISTFKEALQLEKLFCDCSDTEGEQIIFTENKTKEVHDVVNRNNMFETSMNENHVETELIVPANCERLENISPVVVTERLEANGELFVIANCDIKEIQTDIFNMKSELEILHQAIKQIKEQYIKINVNLEKILNTIIDKQHVGFSGTANENKEFSNLFKFPLNSVDEVERVDRELRNNEKYKSFLVKELSKIGGTQGTDDGTKVGYKITDHIFQPELLMEYTWTGVSRKENQAKKPFNALQGICDLYYETILLSDNRHTLKKNENIFKTGILKHAKKRTLRKRLNVSQKGNNPVADNSEDFCSITAHDNNDGSVANVNVHDDQQGLENEPQ